MGRTTAHPSAGRLARHRRLLAVVALLTLATLVTFDCLNLLQSDSWSDLSRAPHLAAVSQAKAGATKRPADRAPFPLSAVPAVALALPAVWLLRGLAAEPAALLRSRPRLRPTGRAPPVRPHLARL